MYACNLQFGTRIIIIIIIIDYGTLFYNHTDQLSISTLAYAQVCACAFVEGHGVRGRGESEKESQTRGTGRNRGTFAASGWHGYCQQQSGALTVRLLQPNHEPAPPDVGWASSPALRMLSLTDAVGRVGSWLAAKELQVLCHERNYFSCPRRLWKEGSWLTSYYTILIDSIGLLYWPTTILWNVGWLRVWSAAVIALPCASWRAGAQIGSRKISQCVYASEVSF